ncbi:MAG TPA: branched-chain amino acid transaminase [Candidatus Eisenbacteria bacterium]|nr:branched-chain amino acid transaminase [Candidatus Eisenbacteria bacterium]
MIKNLDTGLATKASRLPAWAFLDGTIIPYAEARFGLLTHALHYGTGLFAGVRAYWNDEERQLFVFRPEDHFRRFLESARLLRMDLPYSVEDLTRGVVDLLRREGYEQDTYIRPVAFYGDESLGVRLHDLTPRVGIASLPTQFIDRPAGAHVCFSSWRRVSDNAIPPRGKFAGSYVNSALAKTDAVLAGFDESLMLNDAGHVCEGSVENVFIVRRGEVLTPPITDDVLEGITRSTMIQLATELGHTVVERSVDRTEVYLADEAFFCGTGIQVTPITRVDHRPIGDGTTGPITEALRDRFFEAVRGRSARHRAWCRPVFEKARPGAETLVSAGR